MNKITVEKIKSWGPCLSDVALSEIIDATGFNGSATPLEIARCEVIKPDHRLWILLREEIIPEMELHKLGCKFAERALRRERKAGREPHPDSWKAVKIKRLWIKGKATDKELDAAHRVACIAARRVPSNVTRSAARSAARCAAWIVARSVAEGEETFEQQWQIKQVAKILEKMENEK